jgi:hypothetical protein
MPASGSPKTSFVLVVVVSHPQPHPGQRRKKANHKGKYFSRIASIAFDAENLVNLGRENLKVSGSAIHNDLHLPSKIAQPSDNLQAAACIHEKHFLAMTGTEEMFLASEGDRFRRSNAPSPEPEQLESQHSVLQVDQGPIPSSQEANEMRSHTTSRISTTYSLLRKKRAKYYDDYLADACAVG